MASATAAALLTAAARRVTRTTASAMILREESWSHTITIDGFEPSKSIAKGWGWVSKPFDGACDHTWRIKYYPHGNGNAIHWGRHISLFLEPYPAAHASGVRFSISLLDRSGDPVHTRAKTEPLCFSPSSSPDHSASPAHGFDEFITWKELEESGCLVDDRFAIRCDITATTPRVVDSAHDDDDDDDAAAAAGTPAQASVAVAVPPTDLHEQLTRLLWKDKRGADVTVDVGGGEATFDAHGWLLAARSPVLEAELQLATANSSNSKKEKSGGGAHHRRIEIQGVEPKVFEAVLHYMYTDALPEETTDEGGEDAMAMAQGLLAAADRFKLERLKQMCEETLAKRIDVSTVAATLAVAEQHGCSGLKAACMEFMARPGNLKAIMATEGYDKIIKDQNCTRVMLDFAIRQLA